MVGIDLCLGAPAKIPNQDSLSNCDKADAFANNAEQLSQIDDLLNLA